jgi:hypothetical protein
MYSAAIPMFSSSDLWSDQDPIQMDRPSFQEIWRNSRRGMRALIRDILGLISSGSLAEAAS